MRRCGMGSGKSPLNVVFNSATILHEWTAVKHASKVGDQIVSRNNGVVQAEGRKCSAWRTPAAGFFKINVDAAFLRTRIKRVLVW